MSRLLQLLCANAISNSPIFSRRLRLIVIVLVGVPAAFLFVPFTQADRPVNTAPEVGVRNRAPRSWALTNATIVTRPGELIERGTLLIENGRIVSVGADMEVPDECRVVDLEGHTIYPGLIDAWSEIDVPTEQSESAHWNPFARPEREAVTAWKGGGSYDEKLREAGFAMRLIVPAGSILKGTSALVTTADGVTVSSVVSDRVAHHLRLTSVRGASRKQYPNSPMGSVALARQTFYDAKWYRDAWRAFRNDSSADRPETNRALEVVGNATANDELFVFEAPDEQYAMRVNRFAIEFGLNRVVLRGSGREYQRLDEIAATGYPVILPLDFPKAPNVATAEAAHDATLAELMHWHLAPENPARLKAAGIPIAFTTDGLSVPSDLRKRVRTAVQRGLDEDDALHACTLAPAKLFEVDDKFGSIERGKAAHLMICDGDWLDEATKVVETWVDGHRFQHAPKPPAAPDGVWELKVQDAPRDRATIYIKLEEKDGNTKVRASTEPFVASDESPADDPEETDSKDVVDGKVIDSGFGRLTMTFPNSLWDGDGIVRVSATLLAGDDEQLVGSLVDEAGKRFSVTARKQGSVGDNADENANEDAEDEAEEEDTPLEFAVNYPFGAFGTEQPVRETPTVLIENATIWTCGPRGILKDASILLEDGKVSRVAASGEAIEVDDSAQRIDAKGKHVTPGIIDCHSHMATDGGVNEGTQAITAEVRIGDFVDATDISIWRQLAGGVTTANILHGSANPIGGQNQVIKLRWGQSPEAMKFAEAPQGIKFALGENVKQSNWGDDFTTRYPQSRLGVEQIMRDAFIAAKDYEREWAQWRVDGKGIPPRKDLELDALLEIVNGQRWIHCHSYRQDEILALMRTLESFDITIGTFQHILEGYKVAKEMAEHGAMGSAFSDWWAYKFEVYDAIPYNGALMHNEGIVVSFNSDDAELARHLNHEAAKAMKYGGVPPEEALKFVTLNPARQLRIDQYVGSLESGKHADVVIWSGDPLQITSRCEQTWIDGARYFDIEEEKAMRDANLELRNRLVREILKSGADMRERGEHEELLRHLFPRHDEYCGHGHGHGR